MVGRAPLGDLRALAQNPCNPTTTNPHHPHPHPPTRVARVGPALSLRDRLQPAPQPDRPPNQAQKLETQLESAHTRMGGGGGGAREQGASEMVRSSTPHTAWSGARPPAPPHTNARAHTRALLVTMSGLSTLWQRAVVANSRRPTPLRKRPPAGWPYWREPAGRVGGGAPRTV